MKQLKLSEFIESSINEIMDGVSAAQDYAISIGRGGQINPPHIEYSDYRKGFIADTVDEDDDESPLLTSIDFDIAVTVAEDDSAKAGIGIFAASLGLGVQGEHTDSAQTISRIKFQVNALLPQHGKG